MSRTRPSADQARSELYDIMAEDLPFEEKAQQALELGQLYLDVQNAHLTKIDQSIDFWEAIASTDPPDGDFPPGEVLDLQTTFCRRVVENGASIALSDAPNEGWADDPAFQEHGIHCYHGTPLSIDGEVFGTVCFVSEEPREHPFSESETLFAELIARMLEHELRHSRQAAEVNLQANLIGVLSRVLRHNLRNDLNIIRGHLTLMADRSDEPLMQNEAAVAKLDKLVDLANTARQIESITSSDLDRQPVELCSLVGDVIDRMRSTHPAASFTIDAPEEVYLEAIPSLRMALEELIENAAKHSGDSPDVTVSIEATPDSVSVGISDNGPGLPQQERDVLREGAESPLIHGSGLGLWLTYWIISNHDGSITADVSDEGTAVTVTLPKNSFLSEFAESETLLGQFHRERDKFEALFDESFDAIVLIDDDGHYTDVNESAADLFGLSPKELRGRSINEFVPDEFDDADAWTALRDADRQRDTFTLKRADGAERIVEYTAATDIIPGQHLAILRDISERVEQEKEIVETKDRLETIIEASPDPILVLDADGTIQRWNDAAERVFGHQADDVLGNSIQTLGLHSDSESEEFTENIERAMAGEHIENLVVSRRTKHDDEVRVSLSTAPLHDASGAVSGIVAVAQDITDRYERERALKTAKERLERALDVADAVVWEWDVDSDTLTRVPATNPLHGQEIDDIDAFLNQIHPADRDRVQEAIETAVETSRPYEARYRIKKNDEIRWIEDYGEVRGDEETGSARLLGVAKDVTGRVERERRFEALSKGFPDLCFVFDEDGVYQDVLNCPEDEEILYGEPSELVGQAVTDVLPAQPAQLIREHIERTLETGQRQTFHYELTAPIGTRVFQARTHPLSEEADGKRLVALVARDLTDLPGGFEVAQAVAD